MHMDAFDRMCNAKGWLTDAERARRLGLSKSTISNLRAGTYRPGGKVIDRVLTGLECPYAALFAYEAEPAVA